MPADGILLWEIRLGKALADDHDTGAILVVGFREVTPIDQRDLHCLEIIRTYPSLIGDGRLSGGNGRPSIDREARVVFLSAQRQFGDKASTLYAGEALQLVSQLAVE